MAVCFIAIGTQDEHLVADIELLDVRLHGRAEEQVVQLAAVLPVESRRLPAAGARRVGGGRRVHPARLRHPRRLPHPRARAPRLQVRAAQLETAAQGHRLALAQHDVLQPGTPLFEWCTGVFLAVALSCPRGVFALLTEFERLRLDALRA